MTLTLNISPEIEHRLRERAGGLGMDVEACAASLIEQGLTSALRKGATLKQLFAAWDAEDATDDPAELARRRQEFEAFKKSMNENRSSERAMYP